MAKKAEFNIATLKKHIFWVCLPVALLLPLITTLFAVRSISAAFDQRKMSLNGTKGAVEQLMSDSAHPNQQTIDEINVLIRDLSGRVRQAWGTLLEDQERRNVWPGELPEEFLEEIATKKWGEEITTYKRELYGNFIDKYLPAMELFVEKRRVQKRERNRPTDPWGEWTELEEGETPGSSLSGAGTGMANTGRGRGAAGSSGMGRGGLGGGTSGSSLSEMDALGQLEETLPKDELTEYRYVGKVKWANPETRTVVASWDRVPKFTNEIWYAQEELWVYNALLSVIKECNKDATGPHNAVVKCIENLLIGQLASTALEEQTIQRLGGAGGIDPLTGMPMGGGYAGSMSSSGSSSSSYGSGSTSNGMYGSESGMYGGGTGENVIARTEEEVEMIKKNRRYVDEKGVPLLANQESQFEQFKRMPICLRLIVDQRKIPEILVSCANSSMPIDVLWVRINPGAARSFELADLDPTAAVGGLDGTMMDGSSGSYSSSSSSYSSSSSSSGLGRSGAGRGAAATGNDVEIKMDGIGGAYGTNAIPIEIYGCINIFNAIDSSTQLAEYAATSEESGAETAAPDAVEPVQTQE